MVPSNEKTIPMINETLTAAGTAIGNIDTIGFDYLKLDLAINSASAAETALTILRVCESDTNSAITAYTDGTPVTAFVGAAAVSTSAGFVLPARSSTKQNTYRMNMTLLGRKRFIGFNVAPTLTVTSVGAVVAIGTLARAQASDDINTLATTATGMRLIVSG